MITIQLNCQLREKIQIQFINMIQLILHTRQIIIFRKNKCHRLISQAFRKIKEKFKYVRS